MITNKLKEVLSHQGKFTTLSLVVTMLEKCINLLLEYGIKPQTVSFLVLGLEKIHQELKEGYEFVKTNEEFSKIVKSLQENDYEKGL